ncbi:hypothetical protein GW846_04965 [Candidatus Gracilibacteria bacterium]|nr:hypothetical protein [Candidatus Gracilibacteria bacterium]
MLSKQSQFIYDGIMTLMNFEDCSPIVPELNTDTHLISILARERIADIFMLPEDIEDVVLSLENKLLSKKEFEKLQSFRINAEKYGWMELEATLLISESGIIDGLSLHDILGKFTHSHHNDWKNFPRLFLRYFLIVEAEYYKETGEQLAFAGLAQVLETIPVQDE